MLITNGKLITWQQTNQILEDHALLIREDRIEDMGPQAALLKRYPDVPRLDAAGQYVMPGNICAHTHFYGALRSRPGDPWRLAEGLLGNTAEALVAFGSIIIG